MSKFWGFVLCLLCGLMAEATRNLTKAGLNTNDDNGDHLMPFVFSLQRLENGKWVHWCSATVLNENYLLTAAHCLYESECTDIEDEYCADLPEDNIKVVRGRKDGSDQRGKDSYEVQSYFIHPDFHTTKSAEADVAVLQVKEKLGLSQLNIMPVQLGKGNDRNLSKGQATLIRWGRTEDRSHPALRLVNVSLVSHDICDVQYNKEGYNYHPDKMGCVRSKSGLVACHFNGGSPVLYNSRQIGIWFISKDASCSYRKTYMYVSIPRYLKWIKKTAKLG